MTNQNVVVPEAIGIAVAAVATAESPTPVFPYPLSKVGGGDGFNLPGKCLPRLELGENGGSGRINVWLETMKASSPTHAREAAAISAAPCIAEQNEHLSWMMSHPSALSMFDEITSASTGKQIVMFLDYDGTLSPIVNDPECAFMSDAMRDVVREVALYFPTAIVSGRCRDKVYSFVRLAELYYAGSHGMDIKVPAKGSSFKKINGKAVLFQPASKFLPMIDKVYKTLLEATKSTPGAKVENNKFCVSVHFRCVDDNRWMALADRVKSVLKEYPKLRLTPGRKVLEIRPIIKWDKGRAMEFLLESLGFADCNEVLPVYIGDDLSDEDAFKVLRNRRQGFGILVSKVPKETSAFYSLREPSEVMDFLQRLVEWRRLTLKSCAMV